MARSPTLNIPCKTCTAMARRKTAINAHAPRAAVFGIRSRTAPMISPQPRMYRSAPGMWVRAKPARALGSTKRIASIRITRPRIHCNAVSAVFILRSVIKPRSISCLFLRNPFARRVRFDLLQAMARAGIEIKIVEAFQFLNALEGGGVERRFPVKGMQHDAFEKVAESHIVIFGEGLQDFQQAFFHANAGLDAFDQELLIVNHGGTYIPWYSGT